MVRISGLLIWIEIFGIVNININLNTLVFGALILNLLAPFWYKEIVTLNLIISHVMSIFDILHISLQFIFFSLTKYILWSLKIFWMIGFKLSLILNLILLFVWNNCRLRYMNLMSFFSVRVYIWRINDWFVRVWFFRRLCRLFNSFIFQFFLMICNSV